MIKLNDFIVTKESIIPQGGALLVDIQENKVYIDGKATDSYDGFRYTIVLPNIRYEKITVKVPALPRIISVEDMQKYNKSGTGILVDFEGLIGTYYQSSNGIGFSASAKRAVLINK